MTAVAPSGDGGPVRFALSTAASSQSSSTEQAASTSPVAVAKPESSSAGSSTQNQQQPNPQAQRRDSGGDSAATGAYLASLLAASITGRAPEGARPSKITPERLSMLISYLESAVASTAPDRAEDEHAVDVKS
ncbi:hypothetical protein [Quadrisphaera sp. INWT6]|uniref:hypothetical protein n=1 Tax=Quadrisphaera sp. INWT6 TaxID=2596917 RepID=UPI0018928418|nr:hypothetical protein [Quadrisphaera sp. INWT6]MBF5083143.1 hypothetical protein [Quadrisphaera sp. INWT6]